MKTSEQIKAEIAQLSRELAEREMSELSWEDQYGSPFEAVEVRAAEIGDEVMREVMVHQARLIKDQHQPDTDCNCPECQRPGDHKRIRKRSLQTIRGQIEISEPEYYCKKCRRSFFPSDASDRSRT